MMLATSCSRDSENLAGNFRGDCFGQGETTPTMGALAIFAAQTLRSPRLPSTEPVAQRAQD
jgi:hypothetical protein